VEGRGPAPAAAARLVIDGEPARPELVAGGEPPERRLGHAEGGVLHAQRREDPFLEKISQARAGHAGNQRAEDVGAGVVHPPLARLMHQGQTTQACEELVGRERKRIRPGSQPRLGHGLLDRVTVRKLHDRAEAQPEGEQVAQGDGPVRGHRVVERPVDAAQHPAVGQLG